MTKRVGITIRMNGNTNSVTAGDMVIDRAALDTTDHKRLTRRVVAMWATKNPK